VSIAVGLGTSDKQADVAFLNMMGAYFVQAQPLGVVSKENVYNLGKMLLKAGNIQGGESKLLTDPSTLKEQPPAKTPEQTLAEAELQIEQMRQQGKMAEAQQKAADNAAKLHADTTLKGMDLQLKDKEIRIKEIELGMRGVELQHKIEQSKQDSAAKLHAQLHGQMLDQHGAEMNKAQHVHGINMDHQDQQRNDFDSMRDADHKESGEATNDE
jgi:hypothetical protein